MKINSVNNLNFNAKFIDKATILKQDKSKEYKPCDANFVEFDLHDRKDMAKISEICSMDEFDVMGFDLIMDATYIDCFDKVKYNNKRCFALTQENENNFENIDKNKVLGICTVYENKSEDKPNCIAYFMTNYDYRSKYSKGEPYTQVGTGLANALKNYFPNKPFVCYSVPESVNFWRKQGFKIVEGALMCYEV
ncbi:hypothetical protein IJI31_00970 [bacterium]|nr:hypothetical protein [bacterium]